MRLKYKVSIVLTIVILGTSLVAYPGTASCVVMSSDNVPTNKANLLNDAKARITEKFGPMESEPTIIFVDDGKTFWPFTLNDYGSTSFLGYKTCVTIGPKGQNVDVVAHELMHAEIEHRVGFWGRTKRLPVWFEEGLAMQVDFRPRYLTSEDDSEYVTQLVYAKQFFVSDTDSLTTNYSAAKHEVEKWQEKVGSESVYQLLERIKAGEAIDSIWNPLEN